MYVFDCDLFITTDKRLHYALARIHPFTPCPSAQVELAELGGNTGRVVDVVERLVEEARAKAAAPNEVT
jgi:hypothetical protein